MDLKNNRRREALYTRLLSMETSKQSKYFFNLVKMWIKKIRYESCAVYYLNLVFSPLLTRNSRTNDLRTL